METTKSIYCEDENISQYQIGRNLFHSHIIQINDAMKSRHRESIDGVSKKILFLGGGSGAGKTTALMNDPLYDEYNCYNHVDPDSIKKHLPEYYTDLEPYYRDAAYVHD